MSASQPLIYIIEDDQSVRNGLMRLMRAAELPAQAYSDAQSFLDDVTIHSRGCVLLDMTLPRLNGLEVQAMINARGLRLPVIALSARDDDEIRDRARAQGAMFFLRKPVDDQALLDAISWILGGCEAPND